MKEMVWPRVVVSLLVAEGYLTGHWFLWHYWPGVMATPDGVDGARAIQGAGGFLSAIVFVVVLGAWISTAVEGKKARLALKASGKEGLMSGATSFLHREI